MKFTPEQVIEMAREAGFDVELAGVFDPTEGVIGAGDLSDELTRLCTLAADRALEAVNSTVQAKAVAVTAANSYRGKINSAAAFAVGILDDVSDTIRAMKEQA